MLSRSHIPRLPQGVLARPRIVQAIAAGEAHPLTVLHAAPGMGKTTALAQWSRAQPDDLPMVWISLTTSAAGRFAFWRVVLDRVLGAGVAATDSLLADISPASTVAQSLLDSLATGFSALPGRLVLVIDDYHLVRDPAVDEDLLWLLTHVPNLSIVVGTRNAATLTSHGAQARVDVTVIDHTVLALTPAEVLELSTALSADVDAAAISAETRGWPLLTRALVLAQASAQDRGGRMPDAGSAGPHVARGIIEGANGDDAEFLLRISLAEAVTLDLAVALTGRSEAETRAQLDRLESEALGTAQVESGAEVFRLHPLLREEFERMLGARHPAQLAASRWVLAHWLSDHGQPLEAARQAVLTEDWDLLDRIRARHGSTLTMTYPLGYRDVLRSVPDDVLLRHPGLALSRSLLSSRQNRKVPATIQQIGGALASVAAERSARDIQQPVLSRLWHLGISMILNRLRGREPAAASAAAQVTEILEHLSDDDHAAAGSYVALAHTQVAITHLHRGDDSEALHHAHLALEAAERYENEWEAVHAIALICWALASSGDIAQAERWLARARTTTRPHGWHSSYAGTGYRLAEAIVALESFDAEAAEQHIRALDFHAPTIEHWPFMARLDGLIALTRGTIAEGALAVAAAAASHRRPKFAHLDHVVAATRSLLALALGDSASGQTIEGVDAADPIARISLARRALVDGRYEEALRLSHSPADLTPRLAAESLLITALSATRLGAPSEAAEALRAADALLRRFGMRQPLSLVPRSLLVQAVDALEHEGDSAMSIDDVPDRFTVVRAAAQLTKRELVVLNALATTSNLDSIAQQLVVSRNTVKGQVSSLYRKLGVSNRGQALVVATELNLLPRA